MAITTDSSPALGAYVEQVERYRNWVQHIRDIDVPVAYGIVKTPGVVGGDARVFNTRISVRRIVEMFLSGESEDEIAASLPTLPAGSVTAALHYYIDHREEIDREIREEDEVFNET